LGGIGEVIAPHHPECTKRPQLKSAEALEKILGGRISKIAGIQRTTVLYQCHALLCKRTVREAYERMASFSRVMAAK